MWRTIELGKKALGSAAPNPMVGCAIVRNNKIVGEGYTGAYGGPHAEVNAINSVNDKSLLKEATLYVTLEPCSHYGKTPPCADLIVKHRIPKVVIGLLDPHDKVAGAGIHKLKESGCKVIVGVLEKECREHHKRFLTFQEKKRPYIILKWAQTQDGYIAPYPALRKENPKPYWITNAHSQQLVHQWRSEEMAILVGTKTVLEDNPKLSTRKWAGKSPIRVVLDKDLKVPDNFHVLDQSIKTLILTQNETPPTKENLVYETISFEKGLVEETCDILYRHNINSVIVEGGAKTLQTFIDANLWDEARVFKSDINFGGGIAAPQISRETISTRKLLNDTLTVLIND